MTANDRITRIVGRSRLLQDIPDDGIHVNYSRTPPIRGHSVRGFATLCNTKYEIVELNPMQPTPLPSLILPLRRFLVVENCPPEWEHFDLYLFRDEETTFYVGQSHTAFNRVWSHIYDGWKGRSLVGSFVLMNWPRALHFAVELYDSQSERFQSVENDLNRAQQMLITQHRSCFNNIHNPHPTPLPVEYNLPIVRVRHPRNPKAMIREAGLANQQAKRNSDLHWHL